MSSISIDFQRVRWISIHVGGYPCIHKIPQAQLTSPDHWPNCFWSCFFTWDVSAKRPTCGMYRKVCDKVTSMISRNCASSKFELHREKQKHDSCHGPWKAASDIYARKGWRKQDNENCHCTINHGKLEWSLMIPHGYFFAEATILDFLSASWMELHLAGTVTCTSQVMLLLFHKRSRFPTNEGLQKTSEQMKGFYPLQSLFKAKQEHKKKTRVHYFF